MQRVQDRRQGRPSEAAVVIHPATNDRIELPSQIFQAQVGTVLQLPTPDDVSQPLGRFHADRRGISQKETASFPANHSRLEGESEEIKFDVGMVPPTLVILAIDNPGLFRVEGKPASLKPLSNTLYRLCGFVLCNAVNHNVVTVPFEWNMRMVSAHPRIERVMQEEI